MKFRLTHCFLMAIALLASVNAQAVSYYPSMNEAQWNVQLSPFECKLWQSVPIYGDAIFQHKAGEKQTFFLNPSKPEMRPGKAALKAIKPVWDSTKKEVDLGYVPVSSGTNTLSVDNKLSYRLLTELYEGKGLEFTRQSAYADDVTVKVALSSVNFRKAYKEYRGCLAQLLPVNFEQISRSRLNFQTAKWDLTTTARERLDLVVRYVKADPTVTGFYIDGYTDDVGRRLYNLDLSKKRAETVTKYLIANGVDETLITTRYHGERYPVVKNNSRKNRAINRRVTLRLERDGF